MWRGVSWNVISGVYFRKGTPEPVQTWWQWRSKDINGILLISWGRDEAKESQKREYFVFWFLPHSLDKQMKDSGLLGRDAWSGD